jgi:prepilin-type N-terminal cleavage/methylation domain-containing protein
MKKTLKAFSLVEMIITLGILSIVFLLTSKTLTTVVQVSTVNKYKTVTRNEADFAMEYIERVLTNSNIKDEGQDVFIYNSTNVRNYDPVNGVIIDDPIQDNDRDVEYNRITTNGSFGNEIHIQLHGYEGWLCIGYFKEPDDGDDTTIEKGYLLKRSVNSLPDPIDIGPDENPHKYCFEEGDLLLTGFQYPILVLNSEDVNVNDFKVSYTKSQFINNIFYVDIEMEPLFWASGVSIEKAVIRQSIVTTKGLTWY